MCQVYEDDQSNSTRSKNWGPPMGMIHSSGNTRRMLMDVLIRFLLHVEHTPLWNSHVEGCVDSFHLYYGYGPCEGDRIQFEFCVDAEIRIPVTASYVPDAL